VHARMCTCMAGEVRGWVSPPRPTPPAPHPTPPHPSRTPPLPHPTHLAPHPTPPTHTHTHTYTPFTPHLTPPHPTPPDLPGGAALWGARHPGRHPGGPLHHILIRPRRRGRLLAVTGARGGRGGRVTVCFSNPHPWTPGACGGPARWALQCGPRAVSRRFRFFLGRGVGFFRLLGWGLVRMTSSPIVSRPSRCAGSRQLTPCHRLPRSFPPHLLRGAPL
jgi:hypothetical protein